MSLNFFRLFFCLKTTLIIILFFNIFFSIPSFALTTKVTLAFYNDSPPWIVIQGNKKIQGLNQDLSNFLNLDETSKFKFNIEFIPRKRIDRIIKEGREPIAVMWVNETFFEDKNMDKYFWSDPIMMDSQYVLSNLDHKIEFLGVESLYGLRFASVLGYKYNYLNSSIYSGKIKRVDSLRYDHAIKKVLSGGRDVDFCLIEDSMYKYYSKVDAESLDFSKGYLSKNSIVKQYPRRIMVPKKFPEIFKYIDEKTKNIMKKTQWQDILKKYGQN